MKGKPMSNFLGLVVHRFCCVSALVFATTNAGAQTSLPPAVDAFISSASALTKSASELVDLGRSTSRLEKLRREVTDKLLAARTGEPLRLTADEAELLCEARTDQLATAVRRNYIQSVAGRLAEVGKPSKIDNLESAVKSLFANQSVDMTIAIPSLQELEINRKRQRDRCQLDVKEFDLSFYGRAIIQSNVPNLEVPLIPAFDEIGALVQVIVGIITPVVINGAQFIDEEQRRKVILEFLRDPENVSAIQASGNGLARSLSSFVMAKRRKLVGPFFERAAVLRATSVDLSRNEDCKIFLADGKPLKRPDGNGISDNFVLCWRAVWDQLQTNVSPLLKAADDYDQLADAGDSDNALLAFDPVSRENFTRCIGRPLASHPTTPKRVLPRSMP
jgi:hypothetical protein